MPSNSPVSLILSSLLALANRQTLMFLPYLWFLLDYICLIFFPGTQLTFIVNWIISLILGKNQIERVCTYELDDAYLRCRMIKASLHQLGLSLDMNYDDLLAKSEKNFKKSNPVFADWIKKLYELRDLKVKVEADTKVAVNFKDPDHLKLIQETWSNLYPSAQVPSIPSEQWSRLGFQGTDPSTDFRAMGLHGLRQLHDYSSRPDGTEVLQHSLEESKWFPFAVVSINISAFQLDLLKSCKLDRILVGPGFPMVPTYNALFAVIFQRFDSAWMQSDTKDIMDFPRIFKIVKDDFIEEFF